MIAISDSDRSLIQQLRNRIQPELRLCPDYDDDVSLLRWLVGWDREIAAMDLNRHDLSTIEKVTEYCDSLSDGLQYLPDRESNVISLQMIGRCDMASLMRCTRNSELYRLRISESEGVQRIIRMNEKLLGRQLGTTVIMDLELASTDLMWMPAVRVIGNMLHQLQEMFPDVVRKIFIVRAPSFVAVMFRLISPFLAKQTQQKIEFLGDNWRERLADSIDPAILPVHWGGTMTGTDGNSYGDVKMGGPVPAGIGYIPSKEKVDERDLKQLSIPARSTGFVDVVVQGTTDVNRKLSWWWRLESGDIYFSIIKCPEKDDKTADSVNEADYMNDAMTVIWPRFRLQTEYVPEWGEVACVEPGTYRLVFDNTHGKLWSKKIQYKTEINE